MKLTQNQKIKGAKDLAGLQAVAENPTFAWTDERMGLFMDQADGIVTSGEEACQLATGCLKFELAGRLLSHFAKKMGIVDLDVFQMFISTLLKRANKELARTNVMVNAMKEHSGKRAFGLEQFRKQLKKLHKEVLEAQGKIFDAAASVLKISPGAGLEQIGEIAKISQNLISGSRERMLLEEAATDAALPQLRSIYDVSRFADMVESPTAVCTLISAYASEKLDYFPNAVLLLGMIDSPTEMLPDDLASLVNSTRLVIYEVAAQLLSKNGYEATLDQLKHFAHAIRPLRDDGSDTEELENAVNSAALEKINDSRTAAEMASAYSTKSGTHRFLAAYLASLDGKPISQDDLDMITGKIRAMSFGGADVLTALDKLANKHNLEFDECEVQRKLEKPSLPSGLGALLSALSGSDFGEIVMPDGECNCVECQIRRLVKEDIKNSYLTGEWEDAKNRLQKMGVLNVYGEGRYGLVGDMENLDQAMEQCAVCDPLRDILRKAFDPEKSSPGIASMFMDGDFPGRGAVIEIVVKSTSSPDKLRQELEKHFQAGDLDTYKFMTNGGPMTVKEMAAVDPENVPPELMEIVQEYALKI